MKATINGITFDGTVEEIQALLAKYNSEDDDAKKKVAPAADTMTGELFTDDIDKRIAVSAPVVKGGLEVERIETEETETPAARHRRRRRGAVVCWHQRGRDMGLRFYHQLGHLLAEFGIDDSYTGREAAVRIAKIAAGRGKPVASVTMWSRDGVAECWLFDREGRFVNETVERVIPVEIIDDNAEADDADAR